MLGQNKTLNYVVGGLAIASLALLAYTVTRPTKDRKTKKHKRKRKNKKSNKIIKKFTKKPIDIHLVMETMDGFNAHVAGDKKNKNHQLKYGSRLTKINDKKVENLSYQEIFEILQKTKTPITMQFRELDELCVEWKKAEKLKDEANIDYKKGNIESAITKVTSAIQLHPTNKMYYSNRILMYLQNNEYDYALKDCQMIRELDPKSMYIKGHYLRGLTLLKLNKYKNAASAFQTVVKLNPSFKKATDRLNECLKELKIQETQKQEQLSLKQKQLEKTFIKQNNENHVKIDDKNDEKHDVKNDDKNDKIIVSESEKQVTKEPEKQPEKQPENEPEKAPEKEPQKQPEKEPEKQPEEKPEKQIVKEPNNV